MKTLEFLFFSSSPSSKRVEYRRGRSLVLAGVDWGWSELFWFKNNGSRAACKTKSVLSFNYTRHKSLKEGGSGRQNETGVAGVANRKLYRYTIHTYVCM